MLRVGLTGELGSGKSTVARLLAAHGALVLSSDEMARAMMQPGEPVYNDIVARFGPAILLPDGQLNRPELARLAFAPENPRVQELNAIVHPAVLAKQERQLAQAPLRAIAVIESALIFTTKQPWHQRFDRILLVTAPDELKIARYIQRAAGNDTSPEKLADLRRDARQRLAAQRIPSTLTTGCIVIDNTGSSEALAHRTEEVFHQLQAEADHIQDSRLIP